mmetsp:Transcript_1661/g.5898  ORF Transcript_1661/g.5898 Transcript_1661/m.5898 type:complete len:250 (-) Transcript_1661:35-784(-)
MSELDSTTQAGQASPACESATTTQNTHLRSMDITRLLLTPTGTTSQPATPQATCNHEVPEDEDVKADARVLQSMVDKIKQDAKAEGSIAGSRDNRRRMREYQRARRARMTAEQKEEQRKRQREYTRAYRARMTPERKQAMQAKRREAHRRAKAAREAEDQARLEAANKLPQTESQPLMVHHWTLQRTPNSAPGSTSFTVNASSQSFRALPFVQNSQQGVQSQGVMYVPSANQFALPVMPDSKLRVAERP